MAQSHMPPLVNGAEGSLPAHPPSYAQSHDPASLSFPDVPSAELAPIQPVAQHAAGSSLPSLSAVTGPPQAPFAPDTRDQAYPTCRPNHWPSLNPLTAYYASSHAPDDLRMDIDESSTGTFSAASPDRHYEGRANSLSLDDPDVRLAAEALGDLRAGGSTPPSNR